MCIEIPVKTTFFPSYFNRLFLSVCLNNDTLKNLSLLLQTWLESIHTTNTSEIIHLQFWTLDWDGKNIAFTGNEYGLFALWWLKVWPSKDILVRIEPSVYGKMKNYTRCIDICRKGRGRRLVVNWSISCLVKTIKENNPWWLTMQPKKSAYKKWKKNQNMGRKRWCCQQGF